MTAASAELRQETWGVWGGKDLSRRPGSKREAREEKARIL